MKITAKILKSTLKATIKLDLDGNGDKETATNLSLDSLGLPSYLKTLTDIYWFLMTLKGVL